VFSAFSLRFAVDAKRGDRTSFEARFRNLFATSLTLAKSTFVDSAKRFFDFGDQQTFAVADSKLKSLVGFDACDVCPVSVHFFIVGDLSDRLLLLFVEEIELGIQNFTKKIQFSLIHKPYILNSAQYLSKALVVGLCLGFQPAFALDFQSSRTLSLAQSGRGGALLTDTITLNPSLLGFQPAAALSGTFDWINNNDVPSGTANHVLNGSVIDGKNEYVNAGVAYTRRTDVDLIHVALAKRVLPWLSLGASGKHFATRSNTAAASGEQVSGIDVGLSASVALPPELLPVPLQFGITADNLRNQASGEPYLKGRQIGGGFKATLNKTLMLYGDLVETFSNKSGAIPTYSGGAEVALMGDFFARGGLLGFRERGWAAGLGWIGPKIGLSYGYQNRHLDADRTLEHALTLDLFM
jgi:hypothetical protein